jgi:hypothetical protein
MTCSLINPLDAASDQGVIVVTQLLEEELSEFVNTVDVPVCQCWKNNVQLSI